MLKECRNSFLDEDRSGIARKSEIMDLVNAFILADRKSTIQDISEQLGISLDTASKIVHRKFAFSKVSFRWVPKMSTPDDKISFYNNNSRNYQSKNFCFENFFKAMLM